MSEKVRIDKFLWAVRLFKHRTIADKAIEMGQVLINGNTAKPSANVHVGAIISVKNFVIYRQYKVLALIENRIGAPLVVNYIEDVTPEDDLFKLKTYFEVQKYAPIRDKPGRPTKKDRRQLDDFLDDF